MSKNTKYGRPHLVVYQCDDYFTQSERVIVQWRDKDGVPCSDTSEQLLIPPLNSLDAYHALHENEFGNYRNPSDSEVVALWRRHRDHIVECACQRLRQRVMRKQWPWMLKVCEADKERFRSYISVSETLKFEDTYCQLWTGATSRGGQRPAEQSLVYGSFRIHRHTVRSHIFAQMVFGDGHFPGWHVDHKCRNTLCVNHRHLQDVPPRVNQALRWSR